VSEEQDTRLDLVYFTFGSLLFSGTRIDIFRGPQMLRIINECYAEFVRAGWSVPLAFVLDVSAMLLYGSITFTNRWKQTDAPPRLQELALDYYRLLRKLRREPKFQHVHRLLSGTSDPDQRIKTLRVFLRFFLAELSEFEEVVALKSRSLQVHELHPTPDSLRNISFTCEGLGRRSGFKLSFTNLHKLVRSSLVRVLSRLMRRITDYYLEHNLEEFISDEELFMIDYAARSDSAIERIDYHLLCMILSGEDLPEPETWPILNRLVEERVPTESYQQDGRIGGYIDVNRKRFAERGGEILPSEFALRNHPRLMFQKILNEGLLHYIREDIERIEPEIRVLLYCVVDTSRLMRYAARAAEGDRPGGLTPWVWSKALLLEMLRDHAIHFPRENVRVEVVVYLWAPGDSPGYRFRCDLFDWDQKRCESRFDLATDVAARVPPFFHYHLADDDQPDTVRLAPDPFENFKRMCRETVYHCRHLLLFTLPESSREFMPSSDLGLVSRDYTRDSLWLIFADPTHPTVGIARPGTISEAMVGNRAVKTGMLAEEQVRLQVLETTLLKAAARRPHRAYEEMGETANV
jgi:hypothetical protein